MDEWEKLTPNSRLITKPTSDGSGIIVRKEIKDNGGNVWAWDQEYNGSELLALAKRCPEVRGLVEAVQDVVTGAKKEITTVDCSCGACTRRARLADTLTPFEDA